MIKRIFILMAVLSVVASCAPGSSLPTMPPTEAGPSRLGPGDQVRIIVFGQQEMTGDYRVGDSGRSEEQTSELQSIMRISYAVISLQKKKRHTTQRKN